MPAQKWSQGTWWWFPHPRFRTLRTFAKYCPLIAAVLAPLSTLLDIPALAEPWFARNGIPVHDFRASVVLSAVGLALNVLANLLLVLRFSSSKEKRWRHATTWSTLCWLSTFIIEIINVTLFGPHVHRGPDYESTEGFCALTIGYGDLVPTTAWAKILVFPFFVLTISQLANEVLIIFGFIQDRAEQRRNEWRKRYEAAMHAEANTVRPRATLIQEMALIQAINKREEMMSQLYDLIWSALALIVFWVSGAAIFQAIEGWSYGNAVYAVVILTTTIGFGDFVPTAPVGRVVWIPYTLMAVPIVTSFAAQTIAGLMSTFFRPACTKIVFEGTGRDSSDAFKPHSDFVIRAHESYQDMRKRLVSETDVAPAKDEDKATSTKGNGNAENVGQAKKKDEGLEDEETRACGGAGVKEKRNEGEKEGVGANPPITRSGKVPDLTRADDVNPYQDDGGASTRSPHLHRPIHLTSHLYPHSNSVHRQVGRLIGEENEEEELFPVFKKELEFTTEEQKVQSEYQAVERIVKARADEEFHFRELRDGGRGGGKGTSDKSCEETGVVGNSGKTRPKSKAGDPEWDEEETERGEEYAEDEDVRELELHLLRRFVELTVRLEAEARQMLLDSMDKGVARTLLLADRNVQIQDVRAVRGDNANILAIWRGDTVPGARDSVPICEHGFKNGTGPESLLPHDEKERHERKPPPLPDRSDGMLPKVQRYRNTFAEILVLGAILQKLEVVKIGRERDEKWSRA
ncbi:hypothetical protein EHS25_007344 [Saitozyma podzolica]|uniref:Potassium channel domain-containing protein n=1 Tax=Saitozyma podzolica TaxID=1890683 RepID=A0A427XMH2_9TREE|nr:hypothetical protein EHS25_007344 [Saitozyma podzolica]